MGKVSIDGHEFSTEELTIEAKVALSALQILDTKIEQIHAQSAVLETAHNHSVDEIKRLLKL
jgi:hypothetical protein